MRPSGCTPKSWEVGKRKPKGVMVFSFKKNGERYAKPIFHEFYGESTGEEVISRLERLNPGHKFELA